MQKVDGKRLRLSMQGKGWGKLDMACAWWDMFDETVTVQSIYNWLEGGATSKNYHRRLEKLFDKPRGYFIKKQVIQKLTPKSIQAKPRKKVLGFL